jgi:hypothetical protein
MKKRYFASFAVSLVFLCVAIVFYAQGGVSLGKFLLFFVSGVASGTNLMHGIASWRKAGN